mmetsp:Transcript_216/g.811  ORF Transcript_216/g.811 Transcript_216/m.811 type:complete len:222 (+) Transcript_216:769-1434(+)
MMSADVMLNFLPSSPVSATSLAQILMFMSTPLPPAKKQNAWYVARTPFTGLGGSRPSFQCRLTRADFTTPNFSAYNPVNDSLSSWKRVYSATVPEDFGPARTMTSTMASYPLPVSSPMRYTAHRKSLYPIFRSVRFFTLTNTMSTSVIVNFFDRSPQSRQSLANLTLSIAPGSPPPKTQNELKHAFRPGASAGGDTPSRQDECESPLKWFSSLITPNLAAY